MSDEELEAEFAMYADEALEIAVLTQADVEMIEMAMTADIDCLDYAPLYDGVDAPD